MVQLLVTWPIRVHQYGVEVRSHAIIHRNDSFVPGKETTRIPLLSLGFCKGRPVPKKATQAMLFFCMVCIKAIKGKLADLNTLQSLTTKESVFHLGLEKPLIFLRKVTTNLNKELLKEFFEMTMAKPRLKMESCPFT